MMYLIVCAAIVLLEYSIIDTLVPFISYVFYICISRGGSASMVSELRFWVQFLMVTHFLSLHAIILTYLVVRSLSNAHGPNAWS
jgi:hypothetical protein